MAEYKNVENIRNLFDEEFKRTEKLISKGEVHLNNLAEGFAEADRVISRLPTADVVPVVRCKECVFWDAESKGLSDEHICKMHSCVGVHDRYTSPNDYCSYGERAESNEL